MLNQLAIENYRGLRRLEIENLARVNLLVGKNNSGKTSVLEAIQLLTARWPAQEIFRIAMRRGEILFDDSRARDEEIELRHFFNGHDLHIGSPLAIFDPTNKQTRISLEIIEENSMRYLPQNLPFKHESYDRLLNEKLNELASGYSLLVDQLGKSSIYELSSQLGLANRSTTFRRPMSETSFTPVNVITTESLDFVDLFEMWDQIALTPAEAEVTSALQIIEPDIERIAFLSGRSTLQNAGIVLKLKGVKDRIPLGSFGDGVRRILALAFAAISSKNGYLLIDEVDTGLHYSVMADMWKVLIIMAQKLNVQIFATTHSQDCLDGLANFLELQPELATEVSLQRIEKGEEKAIYYTPDQIEYASRRHIEVR